MIRTTAFKALMVSSAIVFAACSSQSGVTDPDLSNPKKDDPSKTGNTPNNNPGTVTEGGQADSQCPMLPQAPSDAHCVCKYKDCTGTALDCSCSQACYAADIECIVESDKAGGGTTSHEQLGTCGSLSCTVENDLSTEQACSLSKCEPPAPPAQNPPQFGAQQECYGFADDIAEMFSINPQTGQATHVCSVPNNIAEIDAIASHPVTGVYYYVSQVTDFDGQATTPDIGWFNPDKCEFHKIGNINIGDIAGIAFHPETAVLYAVGKDSTTLWKFGQDANKVPTAEISVVLDGLPTQGESLAVQAKTNKAYVSDSFSIYAVDLGTLKVSTPVPLSKKYVEALFFTKEGGLYGSVEVHGSPPDRFVRVDPDTGAVTDIGGFAPALYPPGSTARPVPTDIEAMECNMTGAYGLK